MAFLIFGEFLFWVFVCVAVLLLTITVETYKKSEDSLQGELGWPTTIFFIVVGLLIYSNNPQGILAAFVSNWSKWLLLTGGYLVAGILWSFFRWLKVVKRSYKRYKDYKTVNTNNVHAKMTAEDFKPVVDDWKASIASWIIFWPFSTLRYIFGSAIIDLVNTCIEKLKGSYNRITARIYKD